MNDVALTGMKGLSPEDGTTRFDLLEVIDSWASHVTIQVQEDGEILELLSYKEAQCCQHSDATCAYVTNQN
jgi:hypothetical protein